MSIIRLNGICIHTHTYIDIYIHGWIHMKMQDMLKQANGCSSGCAHVYNLDVYTHKHMHTYMQDMLNKQVAARLDAAQALQRLGGAWASRA
jgi:hypothetical protein